MAERLAAHPELRKFVLAGGTALAMQEGPRASADLDFFVVSAALALPPLAGVRRDILGRGRGGIRSEERGTLHATAGGVHVSLLATPYPFLRPVRQAGSLRLAHPVDIGLMKLAAVVQRGSRRDFMDIACILDRHLTLGGLLRLAKKKYPEVRDFVPQALRALVYFADAEREPDPPRLDGRYAWSIVKRRIEQAVRVETGRRFGRPRP